jgi:ABC-type Mn2+/Zn2+ transport system ATPase subunit
MATVTVSMSAGFWDVKAAAMYPLSTSGENLRVLGPNGAGKTTTIRMMLDIFRPSGGSEHSAAAGRAKKARIGYMPERVVCTKTQTSNVVYLAT